MPAYAPQTLSLSLAGSTTPLIWTHWHGNPLSIDISLTGTADFTSCTLLRAELHSRQDSATDGDDPSLLEYVEEANPSTEPTRLTFTAAQLNNLISDGETSRRLWIAIIGIIDGSKYTLGAAWLTVLRDNYSGDTDTAHTPIDNNFLTETAFAASAVRYDEAQSLSAGQTSQARDNIDAAGSGAVTGSGLTMTTARLLGRTTASTGAIEEISIGSGLSLSAGSLSCTVSAAWGGITGTLSAQSDLASALAGKASLSGATFTGRLQVGGGAVAADYFNLDINPTYGTFTASRQTLGSNEYAEVGPILIRMSGSVDSKGLELTRGAVEIVNASGYGGMLKSTNVTSDKTFELPDTAGTIMVGANNLSDVASASTARNNLGLTALATTAPGAGVATFLATPSSANLAAALTDETGTGAAVFATSPTLVTPILGTPTSGTLTNCTIPASGISTGYISDDRIYPLRPSSFAGTYDDDFTGSSLDAKWSRQGLSSGDHTYQTGNGSWMSMSIAAGTTGALARSIYQTWTPADSTITCRLIYQQIGSAYPMMGPFIVDSSGNGVGVTLYNNASSFCIATLASWVFSSFALYVTMGLPAHNIATGATGIWFKLRKSGTTYYASVSYDGIFWGPEVSAVNATTMSRVGMGTFFRAGGASDYGAMQHFDFFKIA